MTLLWLTTAFTVITLIHQGQCAGRLSRCFPQFLVFISECGWLYVFGSTWLLISGRNGPASLCGQSLLMRIELRFSYFSRLLPLGTWSLLHHYLTAVHGSFCLFSAYSLSAHVSHLLKKVHIWLTGFLGNIDVVKKGCFINRGSWCDCFVQDITAWKLQQIFLKQLSVQWIQCLPLSSGTRYAESTHYTYGRVTGVGFCDTCLKKANSWDMFAVAVTGRPVGSRHVITGCECSSSTSHMASVPNSAFFVLPYTMLTAPQLTSLLTRICCFLSWFYAPNVLLA